MAPLKNTKCHQGIHRRTHYWRPEGWYKDTNKQIVQKYICDFCHRLYIHKFWESETNYPEHLK